MVFIFCGDATGSCKMRSSRSESGLVKRRTLTSEKKKRNIKKKKKGMKIQCIQNEPSNGMTLSLLLFIAMLMYRLCLSGFNVLHDN